MCVVLCCCGCGRGAKEISLSKVEAALSQPMEADLRLQTEELEVEGRLSRTGPEVYSFTLTAPEELAGLTIAVEQQNCLLRFGEMELQLDRKALPQGFALALLNTALDGLLQQQSVTLQQNPQGGVVLQGSVAGSNYSLWLDQNCCPTAFAVPQQGITISWVQTPQK